MYAQPVLVSGIALKLAQVSSKEQNCRLSVVANGKHLLIFSTALSETPEFLRRLLKTQIIPEMMLCQRASTDLTKLRTIVTSLIFRMTQSKKNHCLTMNAKELRIVRNVGKNEP